ncbi:MAG TPA: hypothetical protein VF815_02065 [Myxococcaceae bacterium]
MSASDAPLQASEAPKALEAPVGAEVPGGFVRVEPPSASLLTPQPRPDFRVLPVVASVVPGLLFHGLGPLTAGDTRTAGRLFALEGAGLGLLITSGIPIFLTGASRRVIGPLYAVALAGGSLFSISAMANIYSAVSPAFEPGVPAASLPPLELDFGYQYVSDPNFDYGHFMALGVTTRLDVVRLEAAARLAVDEGNARVRLGGAYRLLGAPERARGGEDGTAVDLEVGAIYHRFPSEGFLVTGGEMGVKGRYAMARMSPRLAGSFAEASVGLAFQGYRFFGPVSEDALHQQLLFTFAYGVYLGRGGPLKGEAMLYYDHRKDDYAGGIKGGAGVLGHFGLRGRMLLSERWGVSADVQAGSAYVTRLSAVYALGGEP